MNQELPIWIMEPELARKRDWSARKLFEGGQKKARKIVRIAVVEPFP